MSDNPSSWTGSSRLIFRLFVWCFLVPEVLHVSADTDATTAIRKILQSLLTWQHEYGERESVASSSSTRPFVTLSFAQSLDGKLAVTYTNDSDDNHQSTSSSSSSSSSSSNYPLSGAESLRMTHALRSAHDGILIGGKTLAIDNPRLNNRLWHIEDDDDDIAAAHQPRPIVLDTHLTNVLQVGTACQLQTPILCCSQEAAASLETLPLDAQILACACRSDGKLDLADVLHQLYFHCGIKTIMVEGGADVLSCFLEQGLFDALCVTVAPKLLGKGLGLLEASSNQINPIDLVLPQFVVLGKNIVLLAKK